MKKMISRATKYSMCQSSIRQLANRQFLRTIKTKHVVVNRIKDPDVRENLLSNIKVVANILNSASYNKNLLYKDTYKTIPQIISGQDNNRIQFVIKDLLESFELGDSFITKDCAAKERNSIAKIGLQLFLKCHESGVNRLSTNLTSILMEKYNNYPSEETAAGVLAGLNNVRDHLKNNRVKLSNREDIDSFVDKICDTAADAVLIKKILVELDYKLYSDDTVRIVRGRKTYDELEVSKGWKYPVGILDNEDTYLRSLGLPKNKLVSINKEMIVLVYDGTLRDANKILPSINYSKKMNRSLLVFVTEGCVGEALAAISINNNKNKRNNSDVRTIVMKYNTRDNDNLAVQENQQFLKFLKLPGGVSSIYSPDFSQVVPSTASSKMFYGSLESLKATTSEAFLYNETDKEEESKFLLQTITVNVGGHSEMEINHRRNYLDNLINNILCYGLSSGFLPGCGVSLVKAAAHLNSLNITNECYEKKLGIEAVISGLPISFQKSMENLYGYNKFQVAALLSDTLQNQDFWSAILSPEGNSVNMIKTGELEPWKHIDDALSAICRYISLITGCNTLIRRVYEKPIKSRNS